MQPLHLLSKRKVRERTLHHRRFKLLLYVSACIVLCIAIFIGVRYGTFFKVRAITVFGLPDGIEEEEVLATLNEAIQKRVPALLLGMENILSWPGKEIVQDTGVPYIREMLLTRDFFRRKVSITILPRERFGVWCAHEAGVHCFWFDGIDGVLIEETSIPEGQIIPTVFEISGEPLMLGKHTLSPEALGRLKEILLFFPQKDFSVKTTELDRTLEEVRVALVSGPIISFSLRLDPKIPLNALTSFLKSRSMGSLASIDLTVENKLYWVVR
jgi:hypothetical protein